MVTKLVQSLAASAEAAKPAEKPAEAPQPGSAAPEPQGGEGAAGGAKADAKAMDIDQSFVDAYMADCDDDGVDGERRKRLGEAFQVIMADARRKKTEKHEG